MEEVVLRVVRALVVTTDERDVQEERNVARRQQVVAALAREDRAEQRRHSDVIVEVGERPREVAKEAQVTMRRAQRDPRSDARRKEIELFAHRGDLVEV